MIRRELAAVCRDYLPLVLLSAAAIGLELGRRHFDRAPVYSFLVFNLQLAWIPAVLSVAARLLSARWPRAPWIVLGLLALPWLAFFPNAPYLVTDLVNLKWDNGAPRWYEVALLSSFGWAGLFVGFASLRDMHDLVGRRAGPARSRIVGWSFAIAVLLLSAFGIYLGRELRWNSWDILADPAALLADLLEHVRRPHAHPRAWAMTAVFGTLLGLAYLAYRSVRGASSAGVTSKAG